MNSHYIPRLLLKKFAEKERVNVYQYQIGTFTTKKIKHTFAEPDLFDEELERAFAAKLEGPFGDLLNHKLLSDDRIVINRTENMLIRKFFMLQFLRAPIVNMDWEDIIRRTGLEHHPSVQLHGNMLRMPEYKQMFEACIPSKKTYYADLKQALEYDSLEEIVGPEAAVSPSLQMAARVAMATAYAVWDCTETGLEFIYPKLPGINIMDSEGIFYKGMVLMELKKRKEKEQAPERMIKEIDRLLYGTSLYSENFGICPLSPTRALICFSPYFRIFFPTLDAEGVSVIFPALLEKEQFDRHFYEPMRLELFQPCGNYRNQWYEYRVKALKKEEVFLLNTVLLDMETEEFVFHDYNKIRDSLWYYDNRAVLALGKKHDFRKFC